MNKKIIFLLIAGLAAIVVLFTLPKAVVNNDKDGLTANEEQPVQHSNTTTPGFISEEDRASITTASANALAEDMNLKKAALLQLVEIYSRSMKFDSAALYASQLAELTSEKAYIVQSLELYYEAFTFATDPDKIASIGETIRNLYAQIPTETPKHNDLKTKVAMTWVATETPMQGIGMLREVLADHPDHREATFNLGVLAIQSGQYSRALERFATLTTKDPNDVQSWFYLGLSHKELGNKKEARIALEKVKSLENDPSVLATVDNYLSQLDSK